MLTTYWNWFRCARESEPPTLDGIILLPGGGEALDVLGNRWTIKVRAEESGGAIEVLEASFRPSSGAPAHVHFQHEETFYVLEREFRFHLGKHGVTAMAGTCVFVPRDVPRGFENVGAQPGRILGIMTPGGYERFFEELARLPAGPLDPAKFQEIFEKYDQATVKL